MYGVFQISVMLSLWANFLILYLVRLRGDLINLGAIGHGPVSVPGHCTKALAVSAE